jgi:hypothetical protein
MKAGAYWILGGVTAILLCCAGGWHFERLLASRFYIGETTIRLGTEDTVLSDNTVTRLVSFALTSNSISTSNWTFVPSLQNAPSVVTRNQVNSNHVSVMLTNAHPYVFSKKKVGSKLIANVEVTNSLAQVTLGLPK